MGRFRDVNSSTTAAQYGINLNERWPVRVQVMEHIIKQLDALPFAPLHLLEFCIGPGALAEQMLRRLPHLQYTGIDLLQPFINLSQQRLAPFTQQVRLFQANLNEEGWPDLLKGRGDHGRFHAIVSLQSLHDLGGEREVDRVYGVAKRLLMPGGLFLNADLIVQPGEELPDNPGRRTIARHRELLQGHGYQGVACTLATDGFGCVVGFNESGLM